MLQNFISKRAELNEFKIDRESLNIYPVSKRKKKQDLPYEYESDDIAVFDIEVTSAFLNENGKVVKYEEGKDEKYWNSLIPLALPYQCQFYFNGVTYTFRKIQDFEKILEQFPKDVHFIIWIHNLSYEFHFLINFLGPWKDVFARQPHKPMKAVSEKFPNLEFRCSYTLTRLKLEDWGEDLGLPKLHSLDYNQLRTPLTKLTEEEEDYCIRDVEVVARGIERELETYKHVERIPLTQTGKVRRELKKLVNQDDSTRKLVKKLIPKDAYIYSVMKKCFAGGYTHANFLHAGHKCGAGNQYDFASSYPYVMCSEKFPMTPFIADDFFDKDDFDNTAYMVKIRFTGLEAIAANHYLSVSKAEECENPLVDNGRLISADTFEIWLTDVDYEVISKCYKWKTEEVVECYSSVKRYLPRVYIFYILLLYKQKTEYKDVAGKEAIYAQSKQFINSIFGMSVTDIIQDEVIFSGVDWDVDLQSESDVNEALEELRKDSTGKYFIAFQWGPWITAYARKNLWDCLLTVDQQALYCDTDSIKLLGDADFSWYNKQVDEKLKKMCDAYRIGFSMTRPKTPKGVEKPLGYFAKEEPFSEFVTLGAKRYCYRDAESEKLHLTISGINKKAVDCLEDNLDKFVDGFIFDKDHPSVHKMYHIYTANMPHVIFNEGKYDEYELDLSYGICMRPTGYKMTLSDDYSNLLENVFDAFYDGKEMVTRLSCL